MTSTRVAAGIAMVELTDCHLLSKHDLGRARELTEIIRELADRDDIRAIIISAAGPDFCAETDLSDGPGVISADRIWTDFYGAYTTSSGLYQTMCYCKKPVVVAVQGACTGAGSALVLCADLAVMSDDATIKSPFGTIPEANYVLAALTMRVNRAKAWILTDEPMSANDASAVGLVNRVVAPSRLQGEALAMAKVAARMPMDGMAISKIMVESFLDSQSVGREFDHAGFYASGMRLLRGRTAGAGEGDGQ